MRTLKCAFCEEEIPAKSRSCPSCGGKIRTKKAMLGRKELKKIKDIE